eukprot:Skav227239  [mRNA]  locus=scaffold2789:107509:108409:- [translate_table: standard]
MARIFAYYWVPGHGVKLKDVKATFPLPGQYHFRFKMKWESGAVWMDVTNEESMVPTFEDKVIAKVLRVNWGKKKQSNSQKWIVQKTFAL